MIAITAVWLGLERLPVPETVPVQVFGWALLLGAVGTTIMTFAVQYGVSHMPVHRSAVILLFELVAGAVSSQLLSDEMMSLREWLGGALIIAAAYWSSQSQVESRHG